MPALQPQQPTAHCRNGRAALTGPHLGTVSRGQGGGTATSGGAERKRRPELDQINVAVASVGYRAEHAALARYLALVVNELITAGALPRHHMGVSPGGAETLQAGNLPTWT